MCDHKVRALPAHGLRAAPLLCATPFLPLLRILEPRFRSYNIVHVVGLLIHACPETLRQIIDVAIDGTVGFGELMNHSILREPGAAGVVRLLESGFSSSAGRFHDAGASLLVQLERLPWCMRPSPSHPSASLLEL